LKFAANFLLISFIGVVLFTKVIFVQGCFSGCVGVFGCLVLFALAVWWCFLGCLGAILGVFLVDL